MVELVKLIAKRMINSVLAHRDSKGLIVKLDVSVVYLMSFYCILSTKKPAFTVSRLRSH